METPLHNMTNLFAQLGLPTDALSIDSFITSHSPLPSGVALSEAPFWTASQAAFLRDEMLVDADWAEVIERLNGGLRGQGFRERRCNPQGCAE